MGNLCSSGTGLPENNTENVNVGLGNITQLSDTASEIFQNYWYTLLSDTLNEEQKTWLQKSIQTCDLMAAKNVKCIKQPSTDWKECIQSSQNIALPLRRLMENIAVNCQIGIAMDTIEKSDAMAIEYFGYCHCAIVHSPDFKQLFDLLSAFQHLPDSAQLLRVSNGYKRCGSDGWASIQLLLKISTFTQNNTLNEKDVTCHICTIELIHGDLWSLRTQGAFDIKQRAFIQASSLSTNASQTHKRGVSELQYLPNEEIFTSDLNRQGTASYLDNV